MKAAGAHHRDEFRKPRSRPRIVVETEKISETVLALSAKGMGITCLLHLY